MSLYPHKARITVNGTVVAIQEGKASFGDIVAAARFSRATVVASPASIAVTPPAVQATTIKGNDSYTIVGGEVMTIT